MTVNVNSLADLILKTVEQEMNPETRKILKCLSYKNKEFEDGFYQGLVWASILSVQLFKPESKPESTQGYDVDFEPLGIHMD